MSILSVQLYMYTPLNPAKTLRVAIIGAGLTGLSIARRLAEAGIETRLFDKAVGLVVAWQRIGWKEMGSTCASIMAFPFDVAATAGDRRATELTTRSNAA